MSLCAAVLFTAIPSGAQQYPARPIRLLVPNPPGGATDNLARVVAPKLGELFGQTVVVDNRPGSNGNLATEATVRATPDGHTLLLGQDSQIVISPHLYRKLPFDTLKDLTPVASLVSTQMLLAVQPSLPVKNPQEFVEYARRANPPLAYGSIGNGSQHHLAMEMLKAHTGINLLHVPYKGGGPAMVAFLGGEVAAMFGGSSAAPHVRSGKLRALALAGKRNRGVSGPAGALRVLPRCRADPLARAVRAVRPAGPRAGTGARGNGTDAGGPRDARAHSKYIARPLRHHAAGIRRVRPRRVCKKYGEVVRIARVTID